MARHANGPSGPGKSTAENTSAIKEQEGLIELASESDKIGTVEGAGDQSEQTSAERPRDAGNRK